MCILYAPVLPMYIHDVLHDVSHVFSKGNEAIWRLSSLKLDLQVLDDQQLHLLQNGRPCEVESVHQLFDGAETIHTNFQLFLIGLVKFKVKFEANSYLISYLILI